MIRKYAIIGELIATTFLLAGCVSVPDAQTSDGIKQARGNVEESIDDIVSNGKVSSDSELSKYEFLSETENGYICKVDIGSGDNTLHIDAPIENTGVSGVASLKGKPLNEDMDRNKVIEVFFDGDTTVRDTLEEEAEEEENLRPEEQLNSEEEAMLNPKTMESSHFLRLANEGDVRQFGHELDTGFYFTNADTYKEVKEIDQTESMIELEKDISDDYTVDMAWNEFVQTMDRIGIRDLQKQACLSTYNAKGQGYYSFTYTKKIHGLPLIANTGSATLNQLVADGRVMIGKSGIAEIVADGILWSITEENEIECINVGQLVKILEKYMETGELSSDTSIVYDRCELIYLADTKDWKTATFTPVWHIYVPLEEQLYGSNAAVIPGEIMIDAVSGKLLKAK